MTRFEYFLGTLESYAVHSCIEEDGVQHTYRHLLDQVLRWQSRLEELHVLSGSVVAIRADYSISSIGALLALLVRRVVVTLIPRDRDAACYLTSAHAQALLDLAIDGSYKWCRLACSGEHPLLNRLRAAGEAGLVVFTSGSTGHPRAALQSLERFLYKFRKPGRCFRTMAFLLLDHIAGLDTLFYTLLSGGTLILARRRNPASIVELIESHRVEVLPTSPSFLRMMCAMRNAEKRDLTSLRIITYGSEPMDSGTLARLHTLLPGTQLIQKYGTTETGSPRSISRGNDSLWMNFKKDGFEARVIKDVLWLRGEGMILGYLNAPFHVDEHGWFCTGDVVEVDGEWIRILGREADIINVGGEKVAPHEIEEIIRSLDFVCDVVVSAEPHPLLGETVMARVTLASAELDPKEAARCIRSWCRRRLASYKVPVRIDIGTGVLIDERQKAQRRRG